MEDSLFCGCEFCFEGAGCLDGEEIWWGGRGWGW